jgi:putative ABC transport system permease protein
MNLTENIKEGLRSIQSNLLRTILTAMIIAIGITALVGTLTAVDAIQASVNSNLSSLGANTFDIKGPQMWRRQRRGEVERNYPPIKYEQAIDYKERFGESTSAITTVYTQVTGIAEVKYLSKKTNPNIRITGGDDNYLAVKAYNLEKGRNFSKNELDNAVSVIILGNEVASTLFEKENPIDKVVTALGTHYKVIGVLEKSGSFMGGGGADRMILIPVQNARVLAAGRTLTFDITTSIKNTNDATTAMGEATGLMRLVRHDLPGKPESFEITRSDSLSASLDGIAGNLRVGGLIVGIITLLGSAIGLMNIMMVSVTERTREIGIRKALGATPLRIRQQFLIEAIVICFLGGLIGIILGIASGNLAAVALQAGKFTVPWAWMILGLIVCVIVGLASGYYPARQASRLDPIESLRFE